MATAMKKKVGYIFILIALLIGAFYPSNVWAHASLVEATPAPNSHLEKSPESISLTFNERLESDLYYLRVYDENGNEVTDTKAKMTDNLHGLSLKLPELETGVYSINYKVISADGHPIEETYIITIGDAHIAGGNANQVSANGHQHGDTPFFILRLFYLLSILSITGWLFWGMASRIRSSSAKDAYRKGSKYLRIFLLVMIIGYGLVEFYSLLSGLGINELKSLLFGTTFGLAWVVMLGLSIIGFWILHRSKIIDSIWIMLFLLGEAITGHAITFQPAWFSTLLDLVHLAAAAIWISGLILIISLWKNHREFVKDFLPRFSKYALISITVLVITGSLLTYIFIPDLTLLWKTLWGRVLLLKFAGVLLVILMGYLLRKKLRNNNMNSLKKQLEWDFSLMFGIVLLAAILTTVSPLPGNEPILWEETKGNTSIQVNIGPGNPGVTNTFKVAIDMEGEKIDRKHVSLKLKPLEKDIAAIEVPIDFVKKEGDTATFTAKGPFLSLPGKWKTELRVRDEEDNEKVFTDTFTVYPVK